MMVCGQPRANPLNIALAANESRQVRDNLKRSAFSQGICLSSEEQQFSLLVVLTLLA